MFIYRLAFPQFLQNQTPAGVRSSCAIRSEIFLLGCKTKLLVSGGEWTF